MYVFRLVFYCYLGYIAFIILKAVFDVTVVAIQYYCFGKTPTPAKRTKEREKDYDWEWSRWCAYS